MAGWKDVKLPSNYRNKFKRELLPEPEPYFRSVLPKLKRRRNGWAYAHCPFHKDKNPSFSINLRTGYFKCYGCGECGLGVISYYMKIHRVSFPDACRAFGAWEENHE